MDEKEYLEQRVEDQEQWYDGKSIWNQRWHKRLSILQILAAAVIPFVAGSSEVIPLSNWIVGALGILVAVSTATSSLYKFQENWIQYRTTCETLRHEKYLYLTKNSPYDGSDAFLLFVQNVEGLISRENTKWAQYIAKGTERKRTEG